MWATALGRMDGFRPGPIVVFTVALVVSMGGLGWAMRDLPTGTAYAVWTSLGAVLTVGYSTLAGHEEMSWLKALFLAGIIGCVVGLKRMDSAADPPRAELAS